MQDENLERWVKIRGFEKRIISDILAKRFKVVENLDKFYRKSFIGDGHLNKSTCLELIEGNDLDSAKRGYVIVDENIELNEACKISNDKWRELGSERVMLVNDISFIPPEEYKHTGITAFYWVRKDASMDFMNWKHDWETGLRYRV